MDPMEAEQSDKLKKVPRVQSYCKTWKEFIDRSMDVLMESPSTAKFVIKYAPQKHAFRLKVTDGNRIVMKKSITEQDHQEIYKFTVLVGKALSNESARKIEEETKPKKKNKKK